MLAGLGAKTVLVVTVVILTIWGLTRISWFQVRILNGPSPEEEKEWRDWIHDNLNEEKDDPSESHYSLMCVIGWSRFNIVIFIIIPFMIAVVGAITFGVVWSLDIKGHTGDLAGAWAVSSFVITLAAGEPPMQGLLSKANTNCSNQLSQPCSVYLVGWLTHEQLLGMLEEDFSKSYYRDTPPFFSI